jgi:AbiV family abortive infection protein
MQNEKEIERSRAACIDNAESLLSVAKQIVEPERAHIAYHLGTLALEEIGKSSMIFMSALRSVPPDDGRKTPLDWIDDHARKLFWALWSPRFDQELPWEGIQKAMDLAKHIHETRLQSLYVDPRDANPGARIDQDRLKPVLQLAEARLNIEKLKKVRELSQEEQSDLEWFFAASEDPQLRPVIFSQGSLRKQSEFDAANQSGGWIRWLRTAIEESNRVSLELTQKELSRVPPGGEEGLEDKWEITIRLKSWSHSIRPKQLKQWNTGVDKITLHATSDKRELLIKFVAPKKLQGQMVWYGGQQTANLLVLALNIGTTGFFWWYVPAFTSTYADKIFDLEQRADVVIGRVPELRVSWGNLVLTAQDLNNVGIVFGHLASLDGSTQRGPYERYFRALALIAKNDIFFQFEGNILIEFHLVLREAMAAHGDWDGKDEGLEDAVRRIFTSLNAGDEFIKALLDLMSTAELTRRGENKTRPISLEDAIKLKVMCDAYLNLKARNYLEAQIAAGKVRKAAQSVEKGDKG